MLLLSVVCSLAVAAAGQQPDDDWIDPYDMINYEPSTKSMRKRAQPVNYPNVPTKRREHNQDPGQAEQTHCDRQVVDLNRQIADLKKKITLMSQQPTCNPVFKRFLSRLLKEIQKVGVPSDSTEVFYDAKIKLSRQAMIEIQSLLEGEDSWRTGALDNAINQILVDLRPHNYEAWKWRFEDSFGVELDTVLKTGLCVLVMVAIICTQMWSTVSWLVQFRRLLAFCFFISIVWNWFYLYKIAFAEHQNNIAKMDRVNEKCTGIKKINWRDSLTEWFRSTWTLQDDPCKKYYEVLMVNPILLVPPTKAISVTITTFITEPLKHIGQGISEFLRALLKDLPVTLQIPVLLTIVLSIVICMYGGVQAAFQHGITAPFRHPRRDSPPPALVQPQRQPEAIEDRDHLAGGDAAQRGPRPRANDGRLHRNQVHQRRPNRTREEPARVEVETLRTAEPPYYSEDETDAERREEEPSPPAESDSENEQETREEPTGEVAGGGAAAKTAQSKTNRAESDSSQSKVKTAKGSEKPSKDDGDKLCRDRAASRSQPAGQRPLDSDVRDLRVSAEDNKTPPVSLRGVETLGVPVQPALAE